MTGYSHFGPEQVADFRDDVIHAFQDLFHIRDWLKNDPAVTILDSDIDRLFSGDPASYPNLHLARDIANGSKHLVLSRTPSVNPGVRVAPTSHVEWRPGGTMEKGHISQSIRIDVGGGQDQDALKVLQAGKSELSDFLTSRGLL